MLNFRRRAFAASFTILCLLASPAAFAQSLVITTLAGQAGAASGYINATGSAARFYDPRGPAVDTNGNIYVADSVNNVIRKVTPAGVVTTFTGTQSGGYLDGTTSTALFSNPRGVAISSGGVIYIADWGNNAIRSIGPTGAVTTVAGCPPAVCPAGSPPGATDGPAALARFSIPTGVATDSNGNVYVADYGNNTIRKIAGGSVSTPAGLAGVHGSTDGTGSAALFFSPVSVAVDGSGNVYVADFSNDTIRKMTPAGVVTTLAGLAGFVQYADGTGSAARFIDPLSVATDSSGNVYVGDGANTIRKITPSGVVTTVAGCPPASCPAGAPSGTADGTGSAAGFHSPYGLVVDSSGHVYIADTVNNAIRKGVQNGDANGDGTVTVSDVIYLINNLFAGGPASAGPADANGDGVVNVADIFYLINYLFAGGPPP